MRALVACWAIAAGCGGGGGGTPDGDGGGGSGDGMVVGTPITVTLTNVPGNRAGFSFIAAYQDGTGDWRPEPPAMNDTYTFGVTSDTWGFVYTCQVTVNENGGAVNVRNVFEYHFAVAERTSLTDDILPRCTDRIDYVTISGNISNRPATGTYLVAFNGRATFIDKMTGNYTLLVPAGTHDLLFIHGTSRATAGDFFADAAIVQRNIAVTAAMQVNVAGNTAAATQSLGITVAGTPISVDSVTNLMSANGSSAGLAHVTKTPLDSAALPTGLAAAGDLYEQKTTVEAVANQGVTVTNMTANPTAFTYPSPQPMPLGAANTTVRAAMPYPRLDTKWPAYTGAIGYTWTFAQNPLAAGCSGFGSCSINWLTQISPGAAGAAPEYTMPDLSGLPGWKKALAPVAGTMLTGDVSAMTSTAGAMDFPPAAAAMGTKRVFAHSQFTITP